MSYITFSFFKPKYPSTLYLDKDGVLNEIVLRGTEISSPRNIKEFKLCNDLEHLKTYSEKKKLNLVIISNQPDVSRDLIDLSFIKYMLLKIREELPISQAYLCPHTSNHSCDCRKPKGSMIEYYRKNNFKAVEKEYFIGDTITDLKCSIDLQIPFYLKDAPYNSDISDGYVKRIKSYLDLQSIN